MCIESNSSYLWDTELRPSNAGTWDGSIELLDTCFANLPSDIREVRVRADASFSFQPVFETLENHSTQSAIVARLTSAVQRLLPALPYKAINRDWEMADCEHRLQGWPKARRFVVARRSIQEAEPHVKAKVKPGHQVGVKLDQGRAAKLLDLRGRRGSGA